MQVMEAWDVCTCPFVKDVHVTTTGTCTLVPFLCPLLSFFCSYVTSELKWRECWTQSPFFSFSFHLLNLFDRVGEGVVCNLHWVRSTCFPTCEKREHYLHCVFDNICSHMRSWISQSQRKCSIVKLQGQTSPMQ